ncbi:SPOR domain-containing protein [Sphingobium sp.]|uniref:CHAT domain-containing protein n=1 Tax=Sphingobium sp. TaxID=1912891 RepID=UPI003BB7918F
MALSSIAQAQTDQSQLVRPLGAADLNSNLARLASNPRDVSALIGAGEAALALDDPRAAAGFYARADAIENSNGRIKAGLGRVMLKLQNPAQSLILFDQATRLRYPEATILADRGLARDMTGDQAGAQKDYQAALQRTPDDAETIRRYAASLGISGHVEASDRVMQPLFFKSDRAAWRYRAFILAMNNRQADAQKIALQTMPAQLAAAITPYMQKMPYLTPAQKAAAVHFGHFPAQVGTTIAAVIPTPLAPESGAPAMARTPPTVVAAAPAKAPTRRETASDRRARRAEEQRQQRDATRLARADAKRSTPMTTPAPAPMQPAKSVPAQTLPPVPTPAPTPTRQVAAPVQTVQPIPTPTPSPTQPVRQATAPDRAVQGPPAPGFDSVATARSATAPTSQPAPALAQADVPAQSAPPPSAATPPEPTRSVPAAPVVTQQPDPQATRTLADIIRAIDVPASERQSSVAAVDLTEIQALQAARRAERKVAAASEAEKTRKAAVAKAKAEADAKAKKEAEEKKRLAANPSRNWLQIGVGSSKSALAFTMKGLRKKYDSLNAQDAWSASWGRTNRLLVGPFASFTRAKAVEDKIKAGGGDAFAWKSDAGEVVERLGGE